MWTTQPWVRQQRYAFSTNLKLKIERLCPANPLSKISRRTIDNLELRLVHLCKRAKFKIVSRKHERKRHDTVWVRRRWPPTNTLGRAKDGTLKIASFIICTRNVSATLKNVWQNAMKIKECTGLEIDRWLRASSGILKCVKIAVEHIVSVVELPTNLANNFRNSWGEKAVVSSLPGTRVCGGEPPSLGDHWGSKSMHRSAAREEKLRGARPEGSPLNGHSVRSLLSPPVFTVHWHDSKRLRPACKASVICIALPVSAPASPCLWPRCGNCNMWMTHVATAHKTPQPYKLRRRLKPEACWTRTYMTTHYAHVHATHAQQQPIFATRRIVAAILVSVHVYVIITITVVITIAELRPKACEIVVMNLVIIKILLNDEYKFECPPNSLANKNKLTRYLL